ncbi:MAG: hypothetical protein RL095_4192 [Verrucomicrobiota bacterium]|jgi:hypothetical protein
MMAWKSRLRFFFFGASAWGFLGRVCLLLAAAWFGAMGYILSGKPVITAAPYEALIEDYLKTPPEQRAFPLYAEAFERMKGLSTDARCLTWGAEASPQVAAELQAWLATPANQETLALVREAAKRPVFAHVPGNLKFDANGKPQIEAEIADYRSRVKERMLLASLYPSMGQFRVHATLELRLAHEKAKHGDWLGFECHVRCALAMSRHLCQEKIYISHLVGVTIRNFIQEFLIHQIKQYPSMPASCLTALLSSLNPGDIQCSLQGDRLNHEDLAQRWFAGDRKLKYPVLGEDQPLQDFITPTTWPESKKILVRFFSPLLFLTRDRRETFEDFGRSIFEPGERLCRDFYDFAAREECKNADNKLMSRGVRKALRAPVSTGLVRMTLPNLSALPTKAFIFRSHDEGLRLALACELHQRQHGAYPSTLEDLKPWIPKLPLDPITRGPLHYKLVDGKPLIYSLGLDLDDDGGLRKYEMKNHMDKLNQNSLLRDKIPAAVDGDWILYPR